MNGIATGPVYTAVTAHERTEAAESATPLNRAANADEIAEAASFLASPRPSYVTGAIVAGDGGLPAIQPWAARRPQTASIAGGRLESSKLANF